MGRSGRCQCRPVCLALFCGTLSWHSQTALFLMTCISSAILKLLFCRTLISLLYDTIFWRYLEKLFSTFMMHIPDTFAWLDWSAPFSGYFRILPLIFMAFLSGTFKENTWITLGSFAIFILWHLIVTNDTPCCTQVIPLMREKK